MRAPAFARVQPEPRTGLPLRLFSLFTLLALVVAACGDSDEGGGDIGGTGWALGSLNGQPIVPLSDLTLDFEDTARFSGNTGCNAFSGSYTTEGSSISMDVGPMTLALCGNDLLQEQETAYLAALGESTEYEATDTTLALSNEAGDVLAEFTVLSSIIADTSWEVTNYNNGSEAVISVIIGSEVTANFGTNNDVTGFSGCNDYAGAYTTDGSSITLTPLGGADSTCDPDIANQESQLLNAMINTATFTFVSANRMQFRSADGALQVDFRRAQGG